MTQNQDPFTIYPAIDLRGGQVVRLLQGDPNQATVYGGDPAATARHWLGQGAAWLHVVNLDGAFGEADRQNLEALRAILQVRDQSHPGVRVQFGGGLRGMADIELALSTGVNRAILGTSAVEDPELVAQALERFGPECIGLGIDTRQNRVQVRGWTETSGLAPIELGQKYFEMGMHTCVYTNILRDGAQIGVDVEGTAQFAAATGLSVIASGGVSSLEDVRRVRQAGLSGVIIGRALYEGSFELQEALTC